MSAPSFWDDPQKAQQTARRCNQLKEQVNQWQELDRRSEDLTVLLELAEEEGEQAELLVEVRREIAELQEEVDRLELSLLLNGPYDHHNAIVTIHPGAGGTESQDWAAMLVRMYTRWAESKGYQVEVLDLLPGEEAGVKSTTLLIKGDRSYGYLRAEAGVHRLVRISPFDASGRRHTSFASVDVLPEVDDDPEVAIDPADLQIDTYRASGAGGQHVNKTESAVRITHKPSGIVVQCQNERSQHKNKEAAMKILRARLLEQKLRERQEAINKLRGDRGEIAWGNQIRSYVLCPYTMVKDHRTGVEEGNAEAVLDGAIDPFIEGYLRWSIDDGADSK